MIADCITRYLAHLKRKGYAPASVQAYTSDLKLFGAWLAERDVSRPQDLTRALLLEFQATLFTRITRHNRPMALKSQGHALGTLQGFLKYLVREGLLLVNPGDQLELPKDGPRRPPRHVPTEDEVLAVLGACDETALGLRNRAMMETLYSTGMRAGELLSLKTYDVNFQDGTILIQGGKGGKDRRVPVGRVACAAIETYVTTVRPALVGTARSSRLFVSSTGRRLYHSTLRAVVLDLCDKAGLERPYTAHAFRHACATHMLRAQADIRHIQELLGHRQLSTTQIYTKVYIDDLKSVHARTHPREQAAPARRSNSTDPDPEE